MPSAFCKTISKSPGFSGASFIFTTSVVFSKKSTAIYASRWKKRDLRMFFNDILLEVKLATQPFSNSIRAFAISGVSLITETPLAFTLLTFDFTTLKIMSMS